MRSIGLLALVLLFLNSGGARQSKAAQGPREGKLRVGDMAPDFELNLRGEDQKVRLSSFRGHKPVALVFGSYT